MTQAIIFRNESTSKPAVNRTGPKAALLDSLRRCRASARRLPLRFSRRNERHEIPGARFNRLAVLRCQSVEVLFALCESGIKSLGSLARSTMSYLFIFASLCVVAVQLA